MRVKQIRYVAPMLGCLGVLLVLEPAAKADTVHISLTSAGNDTSHSVYISPYYAKINGSTKAVPVVCDDFTDDSYVPESWTATVYAGSGNLSGTRMALLSGFTGNTLNRAYDAVDYLVRQLPGQAAAVRAVTSFAIWDIFLDAAVHTWLTGDPTFYNAVHQKALTALSLAPVNARYDLTIYSAPTSNVLCGSGNCPKVPPQEFVRTPEAPAPAILAFDLLALLGAGILVRRRIPENA